MTYFEGLDRFGFPEDHWQNSGLNFPFSLINPTAPLSESGGWLMGGSNTGLDDLAGVALYGIGGAMLLPGPTYAAAAVVGGRIAGPIGAAAGVVGYAAASLAVMGIGHGLRSLD